MDCDNNGKIGISLEYGRLQVPVRREFADARGPIPLIAGGLELVGWVES